jgi:hypothetical protein
VVFFHFQIKHVLQQERQPSRREQERDVGGCGVDGVVLMDEMNMEMLTEVVKGAREVDDEVRARVEFSDASLAS